jgi:hypothetical protein
MQEYTQIDATANLLRLKERRNNARKRDIVEFGVSVGQCNLISGVEYLQSRGIEANIILRVLCELLASAQQQQEPNARYLQGPPLE